MSEMAELFAPGRRPSRLRYAVLTLLVVAILTVFVLLRGTAVDAKPSGYLGMSRTALEQQWSSTAPAADSHVPIAAAYYGNSETIIASVDFWSAGWVGGPPAVVCHVAYTIGPTLKISVSDLMRATVPQDTTSIPSLDANGRVIEFKRDYHSTELARLYPVSPFAPDPWQGKPPGTIIVNERGISIPACDH